MLLYPDSESCESKLEFGEDINKGKNESKTWVEDRYDEYRDEYYHHGPKGNENEDYWHIKDENVKVYPREYEDDCTITMIMSMTTRRNTTEYPLQMECQPST